MVSKDVKKIVVLVLSMVLIVTALAGCVPAGSEGTADGTGTEGSAAGIGGVTMILYLAVIIAVFYFFMIRPEKKRKKQAEEMRNSLSVGDNITTIGGMVGKIVNVSGDFITFETGEDRVRIKIAKWGISSTGKGAEESEDKPSE